VVMRDHFVARFGNVRAAALGALFDRERPDLVVCDEVDVGAVVAAERRRIACVTVNVIAAGLLTHSSVVGTAWDGLRRAEGLAPDPSSGRIGGQLTLAPLPRSLRSPAALMPPTMHVVRPQILDDLGSGATDARGASRRGLVYVTLGTVFNLESGDLFERLAVAMDRIAGAHDVEVVLTTGPDVDAAAIARRAPQVRVEHFVALRDVLPTATAVVCHGGSGTLIAALSLGIPVVTLPMGADQPDNADRCAALGVGLTLDPLAAAPADIEAATVTVLTDPSYRRAAAVLAAEAAAQPRLDTLPALLQLLDPGREPPSQPFV